MSVFDCRRDLIPACFCPLVIFCLPFPFSYPLTIYNGCKMSTPVALSHEMEKLLGLADIARAQGISRERVRQKRKSLPPADFEGPRKAPLWRLETLEAAGVRGFS